MARLQSSRDYIGAVDHPDTGELIQLDESHPADVAEVVAAEYDFLRVVYESDTRSEREGYESDTDDSETNADDDTETETFRCGVNDCSRTVNSPDATCWQH